MSILLGPILGFRGQAAGSWNVSALVAAADADAPALLAWTVNQAAAKGPDATTLLLDTGKLKVWRHDWSVKQSAAAITAHYSVAGGPAFDFSVPASGAVPRLGYVSCNGFSNPADMKRLKDKNERWSDLLASHAARPLHILLMGGDQVYSDSMWETVPSMKRWIEKSMQERIDAAFTEAMGKAVDDFYLKLYLSRWTQHRPAEAMAKIPTLMMWDDHDIFDGYGSYSHELNGCKVHEGIFNIASRYFQVFQLQTPPGTPTPGRLPAQSRFTFAHRVGTLAILALDMRSERNEDLIMSRGSWDAAFGWMGALKSCRHLLIMASIPVVHPDFSLLEKALGVLPGQQDLEDDLKDHWRSRTHKEERLRFVHRILSFMESSATRVTLLSGDVHVGAVGVIESERTAGKDVNARVINQLTSSGIVHPAPPAMALHFLEGAGEKEEMVDRGITARMLELPGANHRFIGARNWMSLTPDDQDRLWVEWRVSGETKSFTKVIHPCA